MALHPLGNSDMWLPWFPLTFHQTKWDAPFHWVGCDYCCADWDNLRDHLRDVPLENIFKINFSAVSEFCEWIQVGIDVHIPHQHY